MAIFAVGCIPGSEQIDGSMFEVGNRSPRA
jgi:hypothetical protein